MSSHHSRCGAASMLGAPRPFVLGGTARVYERARPFVIRHLALEIDLDTAKKSVAGVATIDVERVDASATELCLDAVGFDVESAVFVGKRKTAIRYVYDGNTLRVPMPADIRAAKIRIAYRATPARGLYFLEPDEHVQDRPRQVWTQGQDEDARHWFPCHDKPHVKMTFEIRVSVPEGFTALSNGELVQEERPRGRRWTFKFRLEQPQPSYLVTLVAGKFEVVDDRPAILA